MSYDPREPLDAILLPDLDPSPRRTGTRLLLFACLAVGLLFVGAVTGVVVWLSGVHVGTAGVVPWQSGEQRRALLVAAFDGRRSEIQDPDLPEILRLLDEIAVTSQRDDSKGFRRLRDWDGFHQRIACYPGLTHLNVVDRAFLRVHLRQDNDHVGYVDRFEVVRLERPGTDQAIVYAYAFNDDVRGDPLRFLLRRTRHGWKLQDWEDIESGWSQAEHYARALRVGDEAGLDRYDRFWEQLEQVGSWIEMRETDKARNQLRSLAQTRIPDLLSPMSDWCIAKLYNHLEAWDDCLAICSRVIVSERMPGIFMLQASSLNALERYEDALAALDEYEQAAGFRVDVLESKAEILSVLGRQDEAIDCYRRMAEFLPDDLVLVSDYYDVLPPERRSEVLDLLRLAKEPAAVAVEWSGWWYYRDDHQLLTMLDEFVRDQAPDSLDAFVLKGRVAAYQDRYDLAAECYRMAAERETDVEKQLELWDAFLEAMVKEGRASEGYLASPDARRALQVLTGNSEYGHGLLPIVDWPELLDVHRQRVPADPQWHYHAGTLAIHQGDFPAAERQFAIAAAELEDEHLAAEAANSHRDALVRQGKVIEAYLAYADDPQVFSELAERCSNDRDAVGLSQLLDQQRQSHPDDPAITYYDVVAKRLQNDAQAAWDAWQQIDADAQIPSHASLTVPELGWKLQVELGRWRQAYAATPTDETFQHLAWLLRERRDWTALQELCAMHQAAATESSAWLTWAIEAAEERGAFSEVVRLLTPWPEDQIDSAYQVESLRTTLVVSLLRLGRMDEAWDRAQHFSDTHDDHWPQLIVLDHQRRWKDFARLLEQPELARRLQNVLRWGESHHFRNVRWDAEAAELRRQFPPPPPGWESAGLLVLLTTEPTLVDENRLRQLAGDDGPFEVRVLPSGMDPADSVFEIQAPAGRMIVAAGAGTYATGASAQRLTPRSSSLAAILQQHEGWVAVEGVELGEARNRELLESTVRRLAANLIDQQSQAVYVQQGWSSTPYLAAVGPDTPDHLRARPGPDQIPADAALVSLEPGRLTDQPMSHQTMAQRRHTLRGIAESMDHAQPLDLRLGVRLRLGHAAEHHELRVVEVNHEGYGTYHWIGELTADSKLWPNLKSGERLRLEDADIVRWQDR